ncbi:hypothetical protein Rs2_40720 [Raphanus sativus]|uniref:Uncharacterized protein LOC130500034 n=1 Tax=Raphanus sativus TaxID=3726 RepID=A0A9W3CGS7_RAPSA|nr:uncharacterized protein LOC130500034 [Raphanus sativus]KAJ4875702.1 hypothetical protein Rs2_40720 [Raphanus sativus]
MSLILNQPPKLCLRKPVLVRCSPHHSDGSSSASWLQSQTLPYSIFCADPCRPHLIRVVYRTWDGDMKPLEYERPSNFMEVTNLIGSSNGWITALVDGIVRIREHPPPPGKRLNVISLPPHETLPLCQTQMVTNVAMSSSSPEDEDCVVAVKFLGPQLSICKPAQSNAECVGGRFAPSYKAHQIAGSGPLQRKELSE